MNTRLGEDPLNVACGRLSSVGKIRRCGEQRRRWLYLALALVLGGIWLHTGSIVTSSQYALRSEADSDRSLAATAPAGRVFVPMVVGSDTVSTLGYYVAPDGSDANVGSLERPWRTPQRAADIAPVGAQIYLRNGTYPGFRLTRSGLSFGEYAGESAVINGAVEIKDVTSVTVRDLTIQGVLTTKEAGLLIKDSSGIHVTGNLIRRNSFGLLLSSSRDTVVYGNQFTDNASGIEVHYGGDGIIIRNNSIYENTRSLDSSRGATGINFYYTTGHVTFADNSVWGHHTDSGSSGLAIEFYASSNVTVTRNGFWDNGDLLETGTRDNMPCDKLTFTRNVAYKSGDRSQKGLILRCASHSLIAHNTLDGFDKFAFSVSHNHGTYGGSVEGLRIVNNIAVNGRVYSIDSDLPSSVVIDYNLAYNPGSDGLYGKYLAYVSTKGNTTSLEEFRLWTGYEAHGLSTDPGFDGRATRNYTLQSDSPAIDRGMVLGERYRGAAPDMGVAER